MTFLGPSLSLLHILTFLTTRVASWFSLDKMFPLESFLSVCSSNNSSCLLVCLPHSCLCPLHLLRLLHSLELQRLRLCHFSRRQSHLSFFLLLLLYSFDCNEFMKGLVSVVSAEEEKSCDSPWVSSDFFLFTLCSFFFVLYLVVHVLCPSLLILSLSLSSHSLSCREITFQEKKKRWERKAWSCKVWRREENWWLPFAASVVGIRSITRKHSKKRIKHRKSSQGKAAKKNRQEQRTREKRSFGDDDDDHLMPSHLILSYTFFFEMFFSGLAPRLPFHLLVQQ